MVWGYKTGGDKDWTATAEKRGKTIKELCCRANRTRRHI